MAKYLLTSDHDLIGSFDTFEDGLPHFFQICIDNKIDEDDAFWDRDMELAAIVVQSDVLISLHKNENLR